MLEFWKNEWNLFLEDLSGIKNVFGRIFSNKNEYLMLESNNEEQKQDVEQINSIEESEGSSEPVMLKYEPDGVDHKVTAYFGENVEEIRQNVSGDKTQHEVLRDYAQFFKPYNEAQEMCNGAFRKYYDRHALKIATEELPIEQARIIQNNVDLFIKGQEVFGENGQFIDSRVDTIFEKVGIEEVNNMVNILHDNSEQGVNAQGERLFAEVITHMVDNGIKVDKTKSLVDPVKLVLEEKLNDVHSSLKNHEDWNDEYQALLSQERKYLYALNRIEQFETERRISEFEEKLNDIEVV
ncbi:MAG: hypothetical protein RSE00_05350 [Clostridia bacterium]